MGMSDYLRGLRRKVGRDLLVMPAVAVAVFDETGRLLLALDRETGIWMMIGGAVDPDESPADAAVREAFEETGLHVAPQRVLGVFGGREFRITYPNGDVVSYTAILFAARRVGGAMRPDGEEAAALRFVTREEAAALPVSPWNRIMIRHAFAGEAEAAFAPPAWRPPGSALTNP